MPRPLHHLIRLHPYRSPKCEHELLNEPLLVQSKQVSPMQESSKLVLPMQVSSGRSPLIGKLHLHEHPPGKLTIPQWTQVATQLGNMEECSICKNNGFSMTERRPA